MTTKLSVFCALLFFLLLQYFLMRRFFNKLKFSHQDIYNSLGKPTLGIYFSFVPRYSIQFKVMMFLVKRKYAALDDVEIRRLGDTLSLTSVITLAIALSMPYWATL